jgi:ABC-type multidrug transport system fused ATPase/permease subunit
LSKVLIVLFEANSAPPKPGLKFGLQQQFTNYINEQIAQLDKLTALAYVCVAIVAFTVLKNLFLYISLYILNPLRNAVLRRLRNELFSKTLSLPIGFFTEERKGDLVSRMTNDINEVELYIMRVMEVIVREPITIIMFITYMVVKK